MNESADTAQVLVRPPIAWFVAIIAGIVLNYVVPLPFLPDAFPGVLIGGALFIAALALAIWAMRTMTAAGETVPTNEPTTAIVERGPYRYTRNPIYLGMVLALIGLAIALDTLWMLAVLVPFALIIHYGVIKREEAYLERKFEGEYREYQTRVRRWL
jgi:protein-S-isoprenylcysteine O-methyltransferase Ste14